MPRPSLARILSACGVPPELVGLARRELGVRRLVTVHGRGEHVAWMGCLVCARAKSEVELWGALRKVNIYVNNADQHIRTTTDALGRRVHEWEVR